MSSGDPSDWTTGTISLESEFLSVVIHPDAGGNISELTDLRSGRNWLWQNPRIPITSDRSSLDYGRDLDSGGWDEILLSVSPDELELPGARSRRIPDHGDLVRQQWLQQSSPDDRTCTLSVSGELLRYRFSRTISLDENEPKMLVTYELRNDDELSWPWFWCAHALIDVHPDTQIDLPHSSRCRIDSATGSLDPAERLHQWPRIENRDGTAIDVSRSFAAGNRQFASKIFIETPEDGTVKVRTRDDKESLSMTFDREQIPWLGLWINNHGWCGRDSSPYRNLGIEPATAPYDSVVEAVANHCVPWLEPGESRHWSLALELAA